MRRSGRVGVAGLLLLALTGCDSEKSASRDAAERIVEALEDMPAGPQREAVAAVTFNAMCTIGRLAAGEAEGRVETAVANIVTSQPDEIRQRLVRYRQTLGNIGAAKRAELMGELDRFDPRSCTAAPDWDRLRFGVLFNNQPIPHLRFNFCSNTFTYPDGEPGGRAITVGSLLTAILQDPDGVNPPTHVLASLATPSFTGVELGGGVFARDPTLAATGVGAEGITPYGSDTGIPCSGSSNACNASLGQMCLGATCVSFPVVKKDATIVVRGYNLWDVSDARLVFEPLEPGQGSESTAVVQTLDANEPTDQAAACTLPGPQNASFNRAHFRVPANEGHFYRLRLFNHNGTFLTQADGADDGAPRVIHTCFPPSPVADNVPPGTVRDCTPPVETCVQDGAPCSATWSTPPRKLEDCRHRPGETPPCGETPEWYEAELLSPRVHGPALVPDPVVFVEGEASPVFTLTGTLHALETVEETGIDFPGSDEPLLAIVGADLENPVIPDPDDIGTAFLGEDYDEGDRKIEDVLLTSNELAAGDSVTFLAMLFEDDGFLGAFLAGLVAIAAATAIIILTGGAALVAALGGASGVTLIWALLVSEVHEGDDLIGMESFSATALDVSQRIGATHSPTFLSQPHTVGVLPAIPGGARKSARAPGFLVHPFAEFSWHDSPLPECNPGSCNANEQCLVNICVPTGFVDPIASTGFREEREYTGSGGHYAVELQWEMKPKP